MTAPDAAEPAGVRPAPTREEFEELLDTHSANECAANDCSYCADSESSGIATAARERAGASEAALLAAYEAVAAERDEWKRRAEEEGGLARKAESLAARKLVDYAALDIELDEIAVALGYAEEHEGHVMRAPQSTLLRVIQENARRRGEAEDVLDDPRIEAWRALDGEQRDIVLDLLRCAPQLWSYSGPTRSALGVAAAALEALEKEPK